MNATGPSNPGAGPDPPRARMLSVVIPVYDEAENVADLCRGLVAVLGPGSRPFEVLFVDDGSRDGTLAVLRTLVAGDGRVRAVALKRNCGQTAALRAGIDHARGDVIVTMDGDQQNRPEDVPRLADCVDAGCDLACGWRRDRHDPFWSRRVPSRIANWLIARLTGVPIHDTGCSLKAYRAELIRRLPLYADMHRFIPALCAMATVRVQEVVVGHRPRVRGHSKYGLARIGRVLLDAITIKMLVSSSRKPMHWFGRGALACLLPAVLAGAGWVWLAVAGRLSSTLVLPSVCFLFLYVATYLLLAGVFAESVVRADPPVEHGPLQGALTTNVGAAGGEPRA